MSKSALPARTEKSHKSRQSKSKRLILLAGMRSSLLSQLRELQSEDGKVLEIFKALMMCSLDICSMET